ncbi:MAG: DUF2851 family protein [Bacteroidia bacterium]
MTEEFLHYIWKHTLLDRSELKTTEGKPVEIIQTGLHNHDSGPDFFNAKLKIDDTIWVGNVEVHINSSDWNAHRHQHDEAYKNVILHVVWKNDAEISLPGGYPVHSLELKDMVPLTLLSRYEELRNSAKRIPCENELHRVNEMVWHSWMDRLVAERLERKTASITAKLKDTVNDWEEVFYQTLLRNLGNPINTEPFERLGRSLPYKIIARHRPDNMEIEALLLGQAGLLEGGFKDDYPQKLQKEYNYLRHKYGLTPVSKAEWKFMRIRPPHFPTFRLAQLAALLTKHGRLFRLITEADRVGDVINLLSVSPAEYWHTHYSFDKPSRKTTGIMGKPMIEMLIINAVAPLLFIYGKNESNEAISEKGLELLHNLKAENNSIIKKWASLNINADDAYETQALLQLKKEYCDQRKCVHCAIGHDLLKRKGHQ